MSYPWTTPRRYKHVVKNYAVFRAGWWHIPTAADAPGVWYRMGDNNRIMRMGEPRIRNFWFMIDFWGYLWEQWRLGEITLW